MLAALPWLVACQSNPTTYDNTRDIPIESDRYENSPANVFIRLAVAYLNQQDYKSALKYAEMSVKKDGSNPNSHNVLALVYQRLGQVSKADKSFSRALSIAPSDPYINNAYGSFLCENNRMDDSLKYFDRAVAHPLYKEKWLAQTNAGICALRQERLEVAQEYFRKALQNNGKFKIALYNMINLSVLQENYWSARAYLQRYLEVGEHTAETLWWGIKTEKILGDRDKLESFKLLLRAKFPDSDEARLLEADDKK
jgi:type IV pilus assembly protein PilF